MAIHAFISHAHSDAALALAISDLLKAHDYSTFAYETHQTPFGFLSAGITEALHAADVFVLVRSKESATSANVASELGYAMALLVPLYVVSVGDWDETGALFMQNLERHHIAGKTGPIHTQEDLQTLLAQFRAWLKVNQDKGFIVSDPPLRCGDDTALVVRRTPYRDFRSLRHYLDGSRWLRNPPFVHGLLAFRLAQAAKSAEDIVDKALPSGFRAYASDVSHEASFLGVASAFFKEATSLYFVSIEGISSFWIDGSKELRNRYLEAQDADKFKGRLFVFQSRDGLIAHFDVLDDHVGKYGDKKVLVTSMSRYLSIATDLIFPDCDDEVKRSLATFDFAVAEYQGGVCLAVLTPDKFFHVPIVERHAGRIPVSLEGVKSLFQSPTAGRCYRWSTSKADSLLDDVIAHDQDVLHLVRLRWSGVNLKQMHSDFDDLRKWLEVRMNEVGGPMAPKRFELWHGLDRSGSDDRVDRHNQTKINVNSTKDCVLIALIFDNLRTLDEAYASAEFAERRAKILDDLVRHEESRHDVARDPESDLIFEFKSWMSPSGSSLLPDELRPFFKRMYEFCEQKMIELEWLRREDYMLRSQKTRKRSTSDIETLLDTQGVTKARNREIVDRGLP